MESLHITAQIDGPIMIPGGSIALDALLASAVALRDHIPPARTPDEVQHVEIPVQRERHGRFHLASFSVYTVEHYEVRYTRQRPVIEQAQTIGDRRRKRMDIGAGPDKAYQIPREAMYLVDDRLDWWCVGDRREVSDLLSLVHHLGKKRSVGLGRVRAWLVEPCESWGDGFPVVAPDGRPLRHLPRNYPGVSDDALVSYTRTTYPYWLRDGVQECVVP